MQKKCPDTSLKRSALLITDIVSTDDSLKAIAELHFIAIFSIVFLYMV